MKAQRQERGWKKAGDEAGRALGGTSRPQKGRREVDSSESESQTGEAQILAQPCTSGWPQTHQLTSRGPPHFLSYGVGTVRAPASKGRVRSGRELSWGASHTGPARRPPA